MFISTPPPPPPPHIHEGSISLPMLRLLSSKAEGHNGFKNPSEPCQVGIHWIAPTEYSHMSTHIPGFHKNKANVFNEVIKYLLNVNLLSFDKLLNETVFIRMFIFCFFPNSLYVGAFTPLLKNTFTTTTSSITIPMLWLLSSKSQGLFFFWKTI